MKGPRDSVRPSLCEQVGGPTDDQGAGQEKKQKISVQEPYSG